MKNKSLLLINPPLLVDARFIDYPYFVGLGVVSNAAVLRESGFSITVADAQALNCSDAYPHPDNGSLIGCDVNRLIKATRHRNYNSVIVGLHSYLKPHVRTQFAATLFASLKAEFPDSRLIAADCYFGGMHYIEYSGEKFLRNYPQIDAVAKYECEVVLSALLKTHHESTPRIVHGAAEDIHPDNLPFPAWDLISIKHYYAFIRRFFASLRWKALFRTELRTLPAVTSRGCPYRCTFCTSNPGEKRNQFRPHSTSYLKRYFTMLKKKHGTEQLVLLDGCANYVPNRFEEILDIIKTLGLRCEFPNGLRADRLTIRHLKKIKGISDSVTVSAESADQEILSKVIRKGMNIEVVERAARWCRELKLPLNIHYIIGCPGETLKSINNTLSHALRMYEEYGAHPLVQNFVPVPGAPLYQTCVENKLLKKFAPEDIYSYFQGKPVIETPGFSAAQISNMTDLFHRRMNAAKTEKVIINLTYHCNNNCRFCAIGNRKKAHGSLQRYCDILREYKEHGITLVDFDGGEPTLYLDLFHIVRFAKKLGYERITVITNGRRLADRPFASRLLLSGITDLLISIHGHTKKIHEYHTRRKGSFEETVQGIRLAMRLKPRRIGFAINTMVTDKNAPFISEFFRFIHNLGVEKVNVQFITPFGNASSSPPGNIKKICRYVASALKEWQDSLRIELVNAVPCQVVEFFPEFETEVGKHSRDMVFIGTPPRNLADYLDAKREKTNVCHSCEFSVGCSGFYVFEKRDTRKIKSRSG